MRFGLFVAAWGSVLGMSLIYIVVGGMADVSHRLLARRRKSAVEKISVLLFESEAEARRSSKRWLTFRDARCWR